VNHLGVFPSIIPTGKSENEQGIRSREQNRNMIVFIRGDSGSPKVEMVKKTISGGKASFLSNGRDGRSGWFTPQKNRKRTQDK